MPCIIPKNTELKMINNIPLKINTRQETHTTFNLININIDTTYFEKFNSIYGYYRNLLNPRT